MKRLKREFIFLFKCWLIIIGLVNLLDWYETLGRKKEGKEAYTKEAEYRAPLKYEWPESYTPKI